MNSLGEEKTNRNKDITPRHWHCKISVLRCSFLGYSDHLATAGKQTHGEGQSPYKMSSLLQGAELGLWPFLAQLLNLGLLPASSWTASFKLIFTVPEDSFHNCWESWLLVYMVCGWTWQSLKSFPNLRNSMILYHKNIQNYCRNERRVRKYWWVPNVGQSIKNQMRCIGKQILVSQTVVKEFMEFASVSLDLQDQHSQTYTLIYINTVAATKADRAWEANKWVISSLTGLLCSRH